jgi:hypothetical protein
VPGVSPTGGWRPLASTLGRRALVAQGIEQRFPKPLSRSWLCTADLRLRCAWCPFSAVGVLRVGSIVGRLSAKIECRSMVVYVCDCRALRTVIAPGRTVVVPWPGGPTSRPGGGAVVSALTECAQPAVPSASPLPVLPSFACGTVSVRAGAATGSLVTTSRAAGSIDPRVAGWGRVGRCSGHLDWADDDESFLDEVVELGQERADPRLGVHDDDRDGEVLGQGQQSGAP